MRGQGVRYPHGHASAWCDHPGCDRAHPNKPFTDTYKLKMHKRKHDEAIPACPGCSEPIKCDKNMKSHIRKC